MDVTVSGTPRTPRSSEPQTEIEATIELISGVEPARGHPWTPGPAARRTHVKFRSTADCASGAMNVRRNGFFPTIVLRIQPMIGTRLMISTGRAIRS